MSPSQHQKQRVREKFEGEHRTWDAWYGQGVPYDALGFQWRQASGVELLTAHVPPGGRLLDAGCGAGHACVELARRGYEVVGLDIAPSMVELGRRHAAASGVEARCTFVAADLEEASGRLAPFDGILGLGFLEYFEDPVALLRTLRGLVHPGGVVVVQSWNRQPRVAGAVHGLLTVRRVVRPRWLLGRLARAVLPPAVIQRLGGAPPARERSDVVHRRYTAADVRGLARAAGLVPVGETGSRFLGRATPLPERMKVGIERRLQAATRRSPRLGRWAVDYVAALRRPLEDA